MPKSAGRQAPLIYFGLAHLLSVPIAATKGFARVPLATPPHFLDSGELKVPGAHTFPGHLTYFGLELSMVSPDIQIPPQISSLVLPILVLPYLCSLRLSSAWSCRSQLRQSHTILSGLP